MDGTTQQRASRYSDPEPFRYRRGYHRPRPALSEPVQFTVGGHRFETDGKDLWVTPPGRDRIDRIKVTRFYGSSSIRQGYPEQLRQPAAMTEEAARYAAGFWLAWSRTPDYVRFPPVHLDHWVRQMETCAVPESVPAD